MGEVAIAVEGCCRSGNPIRSVGMVAPALESTAQRVLRNSVSLVSMSFFTKGVRLLSMIIMVRFYDPPAFGRFALLVATTELFRVLADFGIDITITKWFLDPRRKREDLAGAAAVLKLVLASFAVIAVIVTSRILGHSGELFWGVVVASASYLLVSLGNLCRAEHQAHLTMRKLIAPSFAVSVVYLVGFTAGVYFAAPLPGLMAIGVACDGLMLILLANRRLWPPVRKPSAALIWKILISSAPIGLLGVFVVAYARISTIILSELLGDVSVAQYSSALRLTEGVLVATGAFAASMLPILAERFHHEEGRQALEELISRYLRKFVAIALCVAIVLNLFSQEILGILFTGSYVVAHQALAVLSWSIVFASINMFFTNVLFAREEQKFVLWISAVNCCINIALSFYLIPRYGIVGAALGTALTELINMVLQGAAILHISHIRFGQAFPPMVFGRMALWAFALLCANFVLPQGTPTVAAIAFLSAYVTHLLLFGDFSLKEIRQVALSIVSLGAR